MASANHLLMMYIGIEMASLPSYALAGFLKGRRQSSEAALKYVVYGSGASGVMLYGISLLAGTFGTGYLPEVANALTQGTGTQPAVLLGALFLFIGFAFKLAAVPFHFWCPDVFEGASAEVAGFLSVASKGAAVALVIRVTLLLTGLDPLSGSTANMDMIRFLMPVLAVTGAVTTTFGNLAAYRQTNLKRLLAYSTIAHAGYMLLGLATLNFLGVSAVLFYLGAYLFMNLGAFAVVAFLRNLTGTEDLADCRGLVRRSPWLVCILAICLLSLLGVPPLVGFVAKFQIFNALYQTAHGYADRGELALAVVLYSLLGIGTVNTVFSAVYYLKVLKVMIIHERVEDFEGLEARILPEPPLAVTYGVLLALLLLVLGIGADPLTQASREGAERYAEPRPIVQEVTQAEVPR
jgi:NADH-quinone oxidoreductase subunit N